jgi:hypothetical protein
MRRAHSHSSGHKPMKSISPKLKKISDLFHIRSAFLRSVNVALDYDDPVSSRDYVVTGFAQELFDRVTTSLGVNSSSRAWRVTGDYGSGKSAFALCFARIAAGERAQLPSALHRFLPKVLRLQPVLISGSPQPLELSIRQGLAEMRQRVFKSTQPSLEIKTAGHLALLESINAHIAALKKNHIADGLVLILDELGQNLHHAALHPSQGDISLLQTLGERADRSGSKPLVVLALLHQGLSTYSADLDQAARREWEKVAGRFKEIVFAQPVEQVAALVAEMLGLQPGAVPAKYAHQAAADMRTAAAAGLYGGAPAEQFLREVSARLYPLHPTVFPLLVRLLRRFGQNERSLVGFLSSHEPYGFREFADSNHVDAGFYRLSHLYDFFKTNLSTSLVNGQAAHWEVIDATVSHAAELGEPALSILKAIGLVNLINDPAIIATESVVQAAVDHPDVAGAIKRLRDSASIIHERGSSKGFTLWPHSSVNLDNAIDQADEALANELITARSVAAQLTMRSVVARRHYIETGNLRHFSAQYLDWPTFRDCLNGQFPASLGADGQILVVLTNDEGEEIVAAAAVKQAKERLGKLRLVGISSPVTKVAEIVRDLKRWQWIQTNVHELAADAYARNHVRREIKRCQRSLERGLYHMMQLRNGDEQVGTIAWFDQLGSVKASGTKGILPYLSERCDKVFKLCPRVPNELINRRVTSSAASRARSNLIEAIATMADREELGFDPEKSPPEFSIYLSVLKRGRLHIKGRDGWRFQNLDELEKDDPLRLAPALHRFHELLVAADTTRCKVPELFDALRAGPYGVRDGFLPLLLAIYLAGQWDQTAVYEDGTFIAKPGAEIFQRLTKEPEAFDLQHCSIRGVRRELFNQVAAAMGLPATRRPEVLHVVRPLMQFAGQLPEYSLYTERHLDISTRLVRTELLKAREPATLLFRDLPLALSFEPFTPDAAKTQMKQATVFAQTLNKAVAELQASYDRLVKRLTEALLLSFKYPGTTTEFREQFTMRIKAVEHSLVEKDLKLFAARIADIALADRAWIEALAAALTKKAPERWRDTDEDEFHHRVVSLAGQFSRTEAVGFNGKALDPEKFKRSIRFTLTRPNGQEAGHVVHWTAQDDKSVERALGELRRTIKEMGPAGLPAAAKLVWEEIGGEKE